MSSCCISHKDEYIPMGYQMREWIPYLTNEKVLFLSSINKVDTLSIINYFDGNEIIKNSECGDRKFEQKSIEFRFNIDTAFYLKAIISDVNFYGIAPNVKFNWDENKNEFIKIAPENTYFYSKFTINGIEYSNVIKINTRLNNQEASFYYVKNLGILSIERADSTNWHKL